MKDDLDPIIVVIATSNKRTDLLLNRSLRSVFSQKNVNPYSIFIVDDNDKLQETDQYSTEYKNIKMRVKQFRDDFFKDIFKDGKIPENHFHTTVIPNTRTHGNSGTGAWNTAIYRSIIFGRDKFIAILDDDDEWENDYLRKCLDVINRADIETVIGVVSGIKRMEIDRQIDLIPDEDNYTIESFFNGNPGFQGSNIFLRLREFLDIGAFDESLPSATDRDLAIRLLQYMNLKTDKKLAFIQKCLVIHHAEDEHRVTSIGDKKKKGLDLFYRKYIHMMDDDTKNNSLERAKRLFDYEYRNDKEIIPSDDIIKETVEPIPFNIIIGLTSNSERNIKELLLSFINKCDIEWLNDYRIVIMENTDNEFEIRPIVKYFIDEKGLKINLLNLEKQKKIIETIPYKNLYEHEKIESKSIAFSRTIVQHYCYVLSKELFDMDNVVWIIDDDLTFECLEYESGKNVFTRRDYFRSIYHHRERGSCDAAFCTVVDAPPLPFISSLRTQLLDIHFNLQWFKYKDPESFYDITYDMNWPFVEGNRDFYYDMSTQRYDHLECPFWWLPLENESGSVCEAFNDFLKDISLLKNGTNICRPIYLDSRKWNLDEGLSILRGGNTVVYDLEMLKVPNVIPSVTYQGDKISPRRSDFNWALVNSKVLGKEIRQMMMPLRHHRRLQSYSFGYNKDKLVRDIYGMIFYRTLEYLLNIGIDNLKDKHFERARQYFEKMFRHYLSSLKINLYRSQILSEFIIDILEDEKKWWYDNRYRESINDDLQNAISSMKSINYEIEKRNSQKFTDSLEENYRNMDKMVFENFIDIIKNIRNNNIISG